MCEPCLTAAEKDIAEHGLLKRTRAISRLPPLFFGDLQKIANRVGAMKELAFFLHMAPTTLRVMLKVNRGRKRLPGWVVRRVYEPLWGPQSKEWLSILPTRVYLVAASVRRRNFRNEPSPGSLSTFPVECSSPQDLPPGSTGMPTRRPLTRRSRRPSP